MTDETNATSDAESGGIVAKAGEVGMQAYGKLPQKAQDTMLNSALKAQPVVSKLTPHVKKIAAGAGALFLLRKFRHRKD